MSQQNTKGLHLTISNREFIEEALDTNLKLGEITDCIGKDKTTISKEIKRNRIFLTRHPENIPKQCAYRGSCKNQAVCGNTKCTTLCKRCKHINCYSYCSEFKQKTCSRLERYPHVCNGCDHKVTCKLLKYKYRAKDAQKNYEKKLVASREGIDLTRLELKTLDELVTPLILKGQSLKHIHVNHEHEMELSLRTLYNYVDMNLFKARNIDLPRKVKYKPRKNKKPKSIRNSTYNVNRKYEDYLKYMDEHPTTQVVEMDTVHNAKSGPGILTLFFVNVGLMLGIYLEALTIECVTKAIDSIIESLGEELFKEHFQLILTDNGSEFKAPELLEFDSENTRRTNVFYCEPYASYQKPHVENNHGFIRTILPKKSSFSLLTQEKVSLMMNHINSVARAGLNDKTPYAVAKETLGEEFLNKLNFVLIPPDEVHLKPALLK